MSTPLRTALRLSPLSAAILLASQPLLAADATRELNPMVISATRTPTLLLEQPWSVSQFTASDFDQRQASEISEVLELAPSVSFGGGARTAGQMPTIRGHFGKQINLIVDGARRNDANSISSPLALDPTLLKSVEIVRGPTSALYGAGGLGGTMVFETLSADDLLDAGQTLGGELRASYESADERQRLHGRIYGRQGDVDGLLALTGQNWGEIRLGDGSDLTPSDGDALSGLVKLGWDSSDQLRLELSHQRYDEEDFRANNPQAGSAFPFDQNNHIEQNETVLKAALRDEQGRQSVNLNLYRSELNRSADANPAGTPPTSATASDTDTLGASMQHTLYLADDSQRLSWGVDGYRDQVSATDGGAANPVLPDGEQRVYGLFVQDEISLGQRWTLIPGLRYDHYNTDADNSTETNSESRLSPRIAAHYQLSDQWGLSASYGEAFRAPTVAELYSSLDLNTGFANFRPNTELKPELAKALELGTRFNQQNWLAAGDEASLQLALFKERTRDLISNQVVGFFDNPFMGSRPIFQAQNVARAERWGYEIDARYQRGNWAGQFSYSHIRVTDRDSDENLFSPPDQAVVQLGYDLPQQALSLHWTSVITADQDYDSTEGRRRDGWDRHDLFISWQPMPTLRVDAGIENLFDEDYVSYFSSNSFSNIAEKGRNGKISVSATF